MNNVKVEQTGFQNESLVYTPTASDDYQFTLGKFTASGTSYFIGDIDDVRLYNRVLSSTEVNSLYNE